MSDDDDEGFGRRRGFAARMDAEAMGSDEDDGKSSDAASDEEVLHRGLGAQFVPSKSKPAPAAVTGFVSVPKAAVKQTPDPFKKKEGGAGGAGTPTTADGAKKVNYSLFTQASAKAGGGKDKDFGSWEKHTKGIGMKLLQRMGYQAGQGLGVAHQGIARPIDVKVRPKNQALQEDNERTMQSRKQFPAQDDEADRDKHFQQQLQQWRVEPGQRRHRPKYAYKTAEELGQELAATSAEAPQPSKVKVVDMTGPQTRVLAGYEQISSEKRGSHLPVLSGADGSVPMPELQHNLNQLIEMAATDLHRVSTRLRREQATVGGLTHDRLELSARVAREAQAIQHLKEIIGVVEQATASLEQQTLQQTLAMFELLRTHYAEEYSIFGLDALAPALAFPLVKRALQAWQPLADPDSCQAVVAPWQPLLQHEAPSALAAAGGAGAGVGDRPMDYYERLCWDIVMPHLRTALSSTWNVREPAPAIRLVLALPQWLPAWLADNVRDQLVLPRLAREVELWDPRRDAVPIHAWVQPWLPLMERELIALFPPIRFKLASCLQAWQPSDRSALAIIKPWRGVWAPADMALFLSRTVVPKLTQAVREMSVDPQNPQTEALGWVAAWRSMLLLSDVVAIFEQGFCGRFLAVLADWLASPAANYDDITQWYLSWKGQFDDELLAQPPIRGCFNRALDLMERAMAGESVAVEEPAAPSPAGPARAIPAMAAAAAAAAVAGTPRAAAPVGLRDLVQQIADECGAVFAPKAGAAPEGKQLYSFGRASIYIDRGVVFAKGAGQAGFQPVSLETLKELA